MQASFVFKQSFCHLKLDKGFHAQLIMLEMSKKSYRLLLQSTYEESERIPDFVNELQADCQLIEETAAKLMLLLSEAVTNAIVHGNKENDVKTVEVTIEITPSSITATVTDEGEGFKLDDIQTNPLAEENLLNMGGRGIFLLKELSDQIDYLEQGRKVRFVVERG